MGKITTFIADETQGKSFNSYKYSHDSNTVPKIIYDDTAPFSLARIGETDKHTTTINLEEQAKELLSKNISPLFTYFLDGSRRT